MIHRVKKTYYPERANLKYTFSNMDGFYLKSCKFYLCDDAAYAWFLEIIVELRLHV